MSSNSTSARAAAQLEKGRLERQHKVGQEIRAARKERTQAELGEMLAPYLGEIVPQTTISRWEQGTVSTDLETLRAIEHALGLQPGTLFAAAGYTPVTVQPKKVEHMLRVDPNIDGSLRDNAVDMYRSLVETSKAIKVVRRRRSR